MKNLYTALVLFNTLAALKTNACTAPDSNRGVFGFPEKMQSQPLSISSASLSIYSASAVAGIFYEDKSGSKGYITETQKAGKKKFQLINYK